MWKLKNKSKLHVQKYCPISLETTFPWPTENDDLGHLVPVHSATFTTHISLHLATHAQIQLWNSAATPVLRIRKFFYLRIWIHNFFEFSSDLDPKSSNSAFHCLQMCTCPTAKKCCYMYNFVWSPFFSITVLFTVLQSLDPNPYLFSASHSDPAKLYGFGFTTLCKTLT
jgi:hypothetical protein